jgi:Ca2+-transporting ATPase
MRSTSRPNRAFLTLKCRPAANSTDPNELPKEGGESWVKILVSQFTEVMVLVLIGAAIVSAVVGDLKDVFIILAIGCGVECRAGVLSGISGGTGAGSPERNAGPDGPGAARRPRADGQRGGSGAGGYHSGRIRDSIPADGRLIESVNLQIEESAMTGESVPVQKETDAIEGKAKVPLAERYNMVFMGTAVAYGRGEFAVTGTGLKTELGNIAALLQGVEEGKTPLQGRLETLGKILAAAAGILVVIVFIAGVLRGNPVEEMLLTAISLAVAAIPEGLPAVITISLSLGASRMVRRNALIRRLPAVETLGSVSTICSDKTGTLTRNEMTTTNIALPGHDDIRVSGVGYQPVGEFFSNGSRLHVVNDNALARFLKASALCTDAFLEQNEDDQPWSVVGDTHRRRAAGGGT